MKGLLLKIILPMALMADTVSITNLAFSNHGNMVGMNEKHDWIGLKYENNSNYGFEIAKFKNSYGDKTKFFAINKSFYTDEWNKFKIGVTLSAGYQEGYCIDNYEIHKCKNTDDDNGIFFIPSVSIKYNDMIGVSMIKVQNITVGRLEFTLYKW